MLNGSIINRSTGNGQHHECDTSLQFIFHLHITGFVGRAHYIDFLCRHAAQRPIRSLGFPGGMGRNVQLLRSKAAGRVADGCEQPSADPFAPVWRRHMIAHQLNVLSTAAKTFPKLGKAHKHIAVKGANNRGSGSNSLQDVIGFRPQAQKIPVFGEYNGYHLPFAIHAAPAFRHFLMTDEAIQGVCMEVITV